MTPRTPIPIARKLGNPGHRRLGHEPRIRKLPPEAAAFLDDGGRAFFERHLPELERVGLATVVDGPALNLLADRYSEVLAWRALVVAAGLEEAARRRWVTYLRQAEDSFRRWATEYGFTALSRTRLAQDDEPRDREDALELDAL